MDSPDVGLLTEKQTRKLMRECMDNLLDDDVLDVIEGWITPELYHVFVARMGIE